MIEERFESHLLTVLLAYFAVVLLLACSGGPTEPAYPNVITIETEWGSLSASGCDPDQLVTIPRRVAMFFRPYPVGYGDTRIEEDYSVSGLTVVCEPAPSTCRYRKDGRIAFCFGNLGGVTHELGHDACYQGAARQGVDCFTVHHAGGQDLLGNRCTVATAGPCV